MNAPTVPATHLHHALNGSRLLVVVGPSGAGKDSVLCRWLNGLSEGGRPHCARRTITRPADPSEDHEVATATQFNELARDDAFAFVWDAHGLRYGVRWRELQPLQAGRWLVLNGSREHLPTLLSLVPDCRVVEITAPRWLREERLARRAREDDEQRRARLTREAPAMNAALRIVNAGDLAEAADTMHRWWATLR